MKSLSPGVAVAVALGFVAAPANAADLPVKAPPPLAIPAMYNWSGLYIGVERGAIMGQNSDWHFLNISQEPIAPSQPPDVIPLCSTNPGECVNVGHPLHGGFVGGEIGFNWQVPGAAGFWALRPTATGQNSRRL